MSNAETYKNEFAQIEQFINQEIKKGEVLAQLLEGVRPSLKNQKIWHIDWNTRDTFEHLVEGNFMNVVLPKLRELVSKNPAFQAKLDKNYESKWGINWEQAISEEVSYGIVAERAVMDDEKEERKAFVFTI